MAQAVERALTGHHHLIVEAGTGTGKTLAYLLPALRTGQRVIISTGTKNLQEQLFFKDVPFLESLLGPLARLLHEGARELSLPAQALCAARSADPEWPGRDRPVPQDRGVGEDDGDGRPHGDRGAAGDEPAVAEAGCAHGALPGPELPGLGALLHHGDAAQSAGERHRDREPSSVFCGPRHQAAGADGARCGHSAGGGGGDLRRGA